MICVKRILFALSLTFFASTTAVAERYEIKSVESGQTVYEIIVADAQTGSSTNQPAPGIYKVDARSGNSLPIKLGSVLGVNRGFNGILAQVGDATENALAIVDGFLTLFNRNSSVDKRDSLIHFGLKGLLPVDIGHGSPVSLPAIESLDDFHLVEGPRFNVSGDIYGQTYLVSVKGLNPLGSGFTFAFVVQSSGSGTKGGVSLLNGRAYLLDYQFLSLPTLKAMLASDREPRFFSQTLNGLVEARLERYPQNGVVTRWVQHLRKFRRYLQSGKGAESNTKQEVENAYVPQVGVPVYDLIGERIYMRQLLGDVVMQDPHSVVQTLNPLTNHWSVHVGIDIKKHLQEGLLVVNEGLDTQVADGRIDYLPSTREYRVFGGSKDSLDGIPSYLLSVDRGALLLLKGESHGYKSILLDGLDLSDIKSINIAHREVTTDKTVHDYVVLSSKTTTGRQKTTLIIVETKDTYSRPSVIRSDVLMDKTFFSQKELELRLRRVWQDEIGEGNSENIVVFDNLTRVLGPGQYQNRVKETPVSTPYLNLTAKYIEQTKDSQVYLRHLKEVVMRPQSLVYRQYDLQGAEQIRTGFYVPAKEIPEGAPLISGNMRFLQGELLKSPHVKKDPRAAKDTLSASEIFMDKTTIDFPSSERHPVTGTISVFPYNPDPGKKMRRNVIGVGIVLDGTSVAVEQIAPFVSGKQIAAEWDSFLGAKIVKGKRKKSQEFTLLLFFRRPDETLGRSGIYSMHFVASVESNLHARSLKLALGDTGWLTREAVFPQALKHRIKSDGPGNLYWVHTPEVNHELTGYAVRRLSEPNRLVYPNIERIGLRQAEIFDEAENWKSGLFSRWQVLNSLDIKSQEAWFQEEYARYNKSAEEARKNGKFNEMRPYIEPLFKQYLDGFADPLKRQENKVRQVIFVEERFKKELLKQLYIHFLIGNSHFGRRAQNSKFDLYGFDPTATDREIRDELDKIADRGGSRDSLLLVNLQRILEADELVEEDDEQPAQRAKLLLSGGDPDDPSSDDGSDGEEDQESQDEGSRREGARPSRLALLGTDGKARGLRDLKLSKMERTQVPMLIVATPQEWANAQNMFSVEFEAGLGKAFTPNFRFLSSGWTLWPPDNESASRDLKDLARMPMTREEYQVFPDLAEILLAAATGKTAGKQRIIVVPEEIKPLVNRLVLSLWATKNPDLVGAWHSTNPELSVFRVRGDREANTQEKVIENFHAIQGATIEHNAVLLADMEAVLSIGRPYTKGKEFLLRDPAASAPASVFLSAGPIGESRDSMGADADAAFAQLEKLHDAYDNESKKPSPSKSHLKTLETMMESALATVQTANGGTGGDSGLGADSNHRILPHLMWWIMSGGQKIQPKKNRAWSLGSEDRGRHTTLILSTAEELERVESEMSFESKFVDLREHFEIVYLPPPAEAVKFGLINSLFDRPEVRSMSYRFHLAGLDDEVEARRQLISHFVNRTEQIALQENIESTTAFVKTFTELRRALVESVELRRSRTIDKDFLERLFSRVFSMPLNMAVLDPSDPLRKLQNTRHALRKMQELGYEGSDALKRQVFDNILSQTTSADEGRPIPSSMIIVGDTSTGKTFLVKSLIKLMDLKLYDMNVANNEEAGAIIVNCANLTSDEQNGDPAKISVKQALRNIEDLLSQPNGHRSLILWDDAHKCPNNEVYDAMMGFIQGLFEAPGGVIYARRKGSEELRSVPVRNLSVVMTLNPTRNRDRIKRYAREGREDDLTSIVLAALARDGRDLEESVLARWSLILNLDKFPRAAKVPALLQRIRGASRRGSRMVLVEPEAVDRLVDKYPNAHAREFLSPAAIAMTTIPAAAPDATMYIVSPRDATGIAGTGSNVRSTQTLDPHALATVIRSINQIDAVSKSNVDSILRLISFILHGMRTQVFNHLVLESQNSEALNLGIPGMANVAKQNFVLAMATHVLANRRVPVSEMVINPSHMNFLSGPQVEELFDQVAKPEGEKPYFPIEFAISQVPADVDPRGFVAGSGGGARERTRAEVIAQTTKKAEDVLRKVLRLYLRVNSEADLQSIIRWSPKEVHRWFETLNDGESEDGFKAAIEDIIAIYRNFLVDFNDPQLAELQGQAMAFNYYDQARIFAYIVDKALMHLPWGISAKFALDVMDASRDLSLGQKPAFIAYAYSQSLSPFAIVSPDFLTQVIPEGVTVESVDKKFRAKCESYLQGGFQQ